MGFALSETSSRSGVTASPSRGLSRETRNPADRRRYRATAVRRRRLLSEAPRVEQGLATPWIGIKERISWYGYLSWFTVFALTLLRLPKAGHDRLTHLAGT
jgi:hypothetical protein